MNRVVMSARETLSAEGQAVFDEIMSSRGKVDEAFQVLTTGPGAAPANRAPGFIRALWFWPDCCSQGVHHSRYRAPHGIGV